MLKLPDGTTSLHRLDLTDLDSWPSTALPIIERTALITSDHHNEDGSDHDESMRSWTSFCNLTDWAMDHGYLCVQNGDFANVAEGYSPQSVYDSRQNQVDKLTAYRVDGRHGTIWIQGNHDHGIINARASDWDGIPEFVTGSVLIHHGHKYYWANYGWRCWVYGKTVIRIKEKLHLKEPEHGFGKWFLSHAFFNNEKIINRGKDELEKRGLKVMVVGHTHQPDLHYDPRRVLIILNVGDMIKHRTFGLVSPTEVILGQCT